LSPTQSCAQFFSFVARDRASYRDAARHLGLHVTTEETIMKRLLDSIMRSRPLRIAALASMCFAASAQAHDPHKGMTLCGYIDAADGQNLLTGRYGEVIGALGSYGLRFKEDAVAASTNLCVAYIMTHSWNTAARACDEAIRFATLETRESPALRPDAHDEHIAIAYSNRAVLEWLQDRSARAADDLARAHALAPYSESVAHNIARLQARLAAAGARAPLRASTATAGSAAHG
jgi:hypothetical protein